MTPVTCHLSKIQVFMRKEKSMNRVRDLKEWGLEANQKGQLVVAGVNAVDLASAFGTPLHVVDEQRLDETARHALFAMKSSYRGNVSAHYPFKCNSVPGIVRMLQRTGFNAEVMTPFELELALRLGYRDEEIIVNGPCKTDDFLRACIEAHVRLIIVDSIEEVRALQRIVEEKREQVDILLRVCPDYRPRGLNRGSATASREGCAFGLDLAGGEVRRAFDLLDRDSRVRFRGFHFHIGTGIRDVRDYKNALHCLLVLVHEARRAGQKVRIVDVGGGFAARTTREFTSLEMLRYQAFGKLPKYQGDGPTARFSEFTKVIAEAVTKSFPTGDLPDLIYEPGRGITSSCQFLLLRVHRVKRRPGVGKWLVADGGLSTVTMPTYYEYHEVFLADEVNRPRNEKVSIIGPACFAGDIVYRNKWMPAVQSGEVLAIMDTGAYFTALESSFDFYKPAIVSVRDGQPQLLRSRELFEGSVGRDTLFQEHFFREEAA